MAEEIPASATTVETSPMAEEAVASAGESAPNEALAQQGEEAEVKEAEPESSEEKEALPSAADHKRKLADLEGDEGKKDAGQISVEGGEVDAKIADPDEANDAKRPHVDGDVDESGVDGQDGKKVEALSVGNGQLPLNGSENIQSVPTEATQTSMEGLPEQGNLSSSEQETTSQKIQVPNNKVGVLIGKAGETIRLLQNNSGARIQIARDSEVDPNSSTRPVELTGTLASISKAEELIKKVIAEAEAGGSPALVALGFSASQSGAEEFEMQVPNEKVGVIIGKGGETIKRLQAESHARIQLIPQHLPEGEFHQERTVRITGNKKQIELAKDKIKDVMNQTTGRPSTGHNQNSRSRGPQWGPRASQGQFRPSNASYGYPPRDSYPPPQAAQYPQQSYGNSYSQQPPPRGNFNSGWEQRPAAPAQAGGYYGQGGQPQGTQPSNPLPSMTSGPVNYNYGQPPAAGYSQSSPYQQSGPQQSYGYNEPKYDSQAPNQQMFGQQQQQQSVSNQQGFYPQQTGVTPQAGYSQQPPYSKPAPYTGAPQSYGPPRAVQLGDPMYQGAAPPSSYGSAGPTQQAYPYSLSAPSAQPAPVYGQSYGPPQGSADAYSQQPPSGGYAQPNSQVAPNYDQVGQQVPAYSQPGAQPGGYGQYPSGQQPAAYGEAPAAATGVNYGYQGAPADAGYGAASVGGTQPGYGQAAGGYAQPSVNAAGYDQTMAPQAAGYGSHPGTAPAGYTKGVSPQPAGYGWPV